MKRVKRSLCLCLVLLVLAAPSASAADVPAIASAAYVLGDPETGEILSEKNADSPRPVATLNAIMTVLLAVESVERGEHEADEPVTAGADDGVIRAEETLPLLDLLYGAILSEADEWSELIAVHLAGGVDAFVRQMNDRAEELGCIHTYFADAGGLAEGQYSTARDLFQIASEAMRHPLFAAICGTDEYEIGATDRSDARRLVNPNALINGCSPYGASYVYAGCVGLKTAYSGAAGYCLVSEIRRDGGSCMAVVLGCDGLKNGGEGYGQFDGSIRLYDWELSQYEIRCIAPTEQSVCAVQVKHARSQSVELYPAEAVYVRLLRDSAEDPVLETVTWDSAALPPIAPYTQLGTMTIRLNTSTRTVPLVTHANVPHRIVSYGLFWAALGLAAFAGALIAADVRAEKKKRARRARHAAAGR